MKFKTFSKHLIAVAFATVSQADTTWTGLGIDNNWTTPDNWSAGVPGNNDYGDLAIFNLETPETVTVDGGTKDVKGLRFETAGWTINGNFNYFKELYSTGAGINTINGNLGETRSSATWNILGADNTLRVNGFIRNYDVEDVTVTGGGTLHVNYLRDETYGTSPTFTVTGANLKIDYETPFLVPGNVGYVNINTDGILQLLTSNVSSVEAMFGGEIKDLTGNGLQAVYDSGSGYTTVSVIPEASTASLIFISGLTAICVLRKRKN